MMGGGSGGSAGSGAVLSLLTGTDGTLTNILTSKPFAGGVQHLVFFMTDNSRISQAAFCSTGEPF